MDTRATDFHFFLESISKKFPATAIFNSEFKCLHIHSQSVNNSVGLMSGLKTLKAFFPWDGTHVVIHNDPMLGCSRIDRIQFLFSIESFHFAIEETFSITWDLHKKIIKIPPIPVVENKKLNISLLDTLASQPDCPKGFHSFVLTTLEKIEKFQDDFKSILKFDKQFLNKDIHRHYLDSTAAHALKTIKSKTYSIAQTEFEFEPGSYLKLKVLTSETGVRVDFQGTTHHSQIQMADLVTDSICFHFFADYFQFLDLMNEATFSLFQITKPTQSFANSKVFPNKLYSDFAGPDLLIQALLDGMSERSTAKPYFYPKSYFQLSLPEQEKILNFDLANPKPIGSLAVAHLFEPLLVSKPTPTGSHIPSFELFNQFGIDVQSCQINFKSAKSKEVNDGISVLQLRCTQPIRLHVLNPNLPLRTKPSKFKAQFQRPTIKLNGKIRENQDLAFELKENDLIELKTGWIEYN